jgi:hypothetical protein
MQKKISSKSIPFDLYNQYTNNGKISVLEHYQNNSYSSDHSIIYEKELVEDFVSRAIKNNAFTTRKLQENL